MSSFEEELKSDFIQEALDLLDSAEQAFLRLESDPDSESTLNEIFRFAHNLKGTSRAVGFGEVAQFTHEVENLILKLKQKEIPSSSTTISLLLKCNDHIQMMVHGLKDDFNASFDSTDLIAQLQAVQSGEFSESVEEIIEPIEPSIATMESPSTMVEPPDSSINPEDFEDAFTEEFIPEGTNVEKLSVVPLNEIKMVPNENWGGEKPSKVKKVNSTGGAKSSEEESIRVALSKIERLNNYVGELILMQTVLEQRRFHHIKDDLANNSITQLSKIAKEIQDISMSMRLIPLKNTFLKMNRIVRDTSSLLGKNATLKIEGEDTEIDKTILDSVVDPLVHIIRNAVDHGIESPEERAASGKSEEGIIELKSYHSGNHLVIEVIDDGKGIDPEYIRIKAIEKGLIRESDQCTNQALIQFLFHPGFSTKDQVSEVSGRGVGMDVVKTNIESLGGEVHLFSEKGKGSTCKIHLPLTLAIIEGIITQVGGLNYIFPLSQIKEVVRPREKMVEKITGIGNCLKLRGDVMPIFDICKDMHGVESTIPVTESICIVCSSHDSKFAVQIEDIINKQQIVVKALGPDIRNQKGFMGGSILGNGQPSFIIDLEELYKDRLDSSLISRKDYMEA